MPRKLPEKGLGLGTLCSVGMSVGASLIAATALTPASAQTTFQSTASRTVDPRLTPRTPLQRPLQMQGEAPVNGIQPTLNVQMMGTSNSELARGGNAKGKGELVLSVIPGIGFQLKGAQSELVGQFQLEALRYTRGTQPDRVLPSGDVRLKIEPVKDAVGVESTLRAAQVRADTTTAARPSGASSTANAYTEATLNIAPYVRARLDSHTVAEARVERGLLNTTQYTPPPPGSLTDNGQRDAYLSDDRVRVLRQPVPLGYEVQAHERSERFKGASTPALEQRELSATVLLAPDPELTLGLKVLRADDTLQGQKSSQTGLGYQAQWRPTERTLLLAEAENRSYGRTWMADFQHRWRWVSVGVRAERMATSYARESSRSRNLLEPDQPFDTGAQLRNAVQGRMTVMGRRNQLNFAAGLIKSASLLGGDDGNPITGGRRSREHYFETQLVHQLTPANSLTGALRWGRVLATQPLTGAETLSRDFTARAALNTKLSLDTTATVGLKRQITHNTPTSNANETAGYIGLGHRF